MQHLSSVLCLHMRGNDAFLHAVAILGKKNRLGVKKNMGIKIAQQDFLFVENIHQGTMHLASKLRKENILSFFFKYRC